MLSVVYDELFIRIKPKDDICILKSPILKNIGLNNSKTGEIIWLSDNKSYEKIPPIILKFLELRGLLKIKKTPILESIGLYKVIDLQNGIKLKNDIANIIEEINIDTLEEDYIKLDRFIKNALYIGRMFTKKNINAPKYLLLYEFNSVYLLKSIETNNYIFVDKYFTFLKGYEIGSIIKEYYDKQSVLNAIIEQENPEKKNKRTL